MLDQKYPASILIRERISQRTLGKHHHSHILLRTHKVSFQLQIPSKCQHSPSRSRATSTRNTMDRNDTSLGLDSGANSTSRPRCALKMPVGLHSAVPPSPQRRASSMPVGLDGAMSLSRPSHRRYVWLAGLDNAAKLSPSRDEGAKPNLHLKSGAKPFGLAAAVRQNKIGQRPFGPYVCREWETCWFCTEYVEPPRHERRRSDSEASVRERQEASSKRGKALREEREAADAVKKQEKKNKQKQLWIERQLQGFKLAAKNMRGGTR
jgi:hypothetical protein